MSGVSAGMIFYERGKFGDENLMSGGSSGMIYDERGKCGDDI